jgi:hypothetical protein
MLALVAALAACSQSAPAPTSTVSPAQAAADVSSTAYAGCVDKAVAALDVAADQPAALTDRAMKACIDARADVVAKVAAASVATGKDAATAAQIAEASVRLADSELRARANTAIVTRKLKAS